MDVRRAGKRAGAGGLALMLLALGGCAQTLHGAFEPIDLGAKLHTDHRIEMASLPIALSPGDPSIERVGQLTYRGGLFLRSPDQRFGGLSGLMVSPDGTELLAVSTAGYWFTADLSYDDGRLSGLSGARLAPLRDPAGKPLRPPMGVPGAVAPASSQGFGGPLYVALDRTHKILRYPVSKDRLASVPTVVELPEDARRPTVKGGINALQRLDDHTLFALSEDVRDRKDDIQGWLVAVSPEADAARHGVVFLKAVRDYMPTDMATLPGGDLLVLERSFSLRRGAGLEIRRIKRKDIVPYAALDGEVIARLDVHYSIDNMEGLAVRTGEHGETLLYLVSNDNFNGLQRTVLLEFELSPKAALAKR